MWNDQDEINQFKEILEVIDCQLTEDTEEDVREIIDKEIDDHGARVLEGYKWLRGAWATTDFMDPEQVKMFREDILKGIAYAEKCLERSKGSRQSLSEYKAKRKIAKNRLLARIRAKLSAPPEEVNAPGDKIVGISRVNVRRRNK